MKYWRRYLIIFLIAFIGLILFRVYQIESRPEIPVQNAVITSQTQDIPLNADRILELVNIERKKVNVAPLVIDTGLVNTAQSRADDMSSRNYFSHNDPITGENMVNILKQQKQCVYASENIVWIKYPNTLEDNQESIDTWLNSPAHKEAMLDPKYTITGVGVKDKRVVQHFCQV